MNVKRLLLLSLSLIFCTTIWAQKENLNTNKFKQLGQELPTPNVYRNASGAPGHAYWQQKADYVIDLELNDKEQKIYGEETITYTNNSPEALDYLWLQLDQNMRAQDSDTKKIRETSMSRRTLQRMNNDFDGGFKIDHVKDGNGKALTYVINKTMMRINLPTKLKAGGKFSFKVKWWYNINNTKEIGGRSGYEPFKDGNNVYCIAQFFPRMCAYNEVEGWQNKQFLGRGEFALVFGDYKVNITVPADHLVAASGVLQNAKSVLSKDHKSRLDEAANAYEHPVVIATLEEADERSKKTEESTKKTWTFQADNVRDFAFSSSRRFIWDAMAVKMESGKNVMAMSMYVKEGDCLWSKYSTEAIAHTLKWYSHYTFEYPYPVAWSIDGSMGMEYPMICFNPGRAEDDGTYTERAKNACITVVIHEVGHNYFPMIINSDERQWAWFDEGLNSFLQFVTEQEFDNNYKSTGGPAHMIAGYMASDKDKLEPIMTNSENIISYFDNAYNKPATALNILRETIMGRELFDYAFREYCQRWKFKHPTPADFFRTMEDASGTDLDWFWKGWFFSTDAVDIAIDTVVWYQVDLKANPKKKDYTYTNRAAKPFDHVTKKRYRADGTKFPVEEDETLQDFYTNYKQWEEADSVTKGVIKLYEETYKKKEKKKLYGDKNYYELKFSNKGGLVMPIIIEWTFEDGTTQIERVPVEIWRHNEETVTKVFVKNKEVKSITLDPNRETADTDEANNQWPKDLSPKPSRFKVYKKHKYEEVQNSMQRAKEAGKTIKP